MCDQPTASNSKRPQIPARFQKEDFLRFLHRIGVPEEIISAADGKLPESVDLEENRKFLLEYGLDKDELMDRMGASP